METPTSPEDATTPGRAEEATQLVTAPFLCPSSCRGFGSAAAAGSGAAATAADSVSDMEALDEGDVKGEQTLRLEFERSTSAQPSSSFQVGNGRR